MKPNLEHDSGQEEIAVDGFLSVSFTPISRLVLTSNCPRRQAYPVVTRLKADAYRDQVSAGRGMGLTLAGKFKSNRPL